MGADDHALPRFGRAGQYGDNVVDLDVLIDTPECLNAVLIERNCEAGAKALELAGASGFPARYSAGLPS